MIQLMLYQFQPDHTHQLLAVTLEQDRKSGHASVSDVFGFNVKLDASSELETLGLQKLTSGLKTLSAGLYTNMHDGRHSWIYPASMRREDGTAPPESFDARVADVQSWLQDRFIDIHNTYANGVAMMRDTSNLRLNVPRAQILFAGAPVLPEMAAEM